MRYGPDIAPDILAPYTLGNNEYGVSRVKSCDKCINALKDITQGEGDWAYDETPQFLVDPCIISDEMKLPYDKCYEIAAEVNHMLGERGILEYEDDSAELVWQEYMEKR
jgi:hypothetical protein